MASCTYELNSRTVTTVSAQINIGPRSVAVAYATQARGADVIGWNPANLGLADNPRFGMSFGLLPIVPMPALQLNNDLFTVNWFNQWFTKGEYLDAGDKADLLGTFPVEGVKFNPLVGAKLIGMNFGSLAFDVNFELHTNVVLPKGFFDFALNGNEFGKPVQLDGLKLDVQSVIPISFAYGRRFDIPGLEQFIDATYFGGAIRLLAGATTGSIEKFDVDITTYDDRVEMSGTVTGKYAIGGFGTALDVGAVADINQKMRANIAINNLIGFVSWSDAHAEQYEISFDGSVASSEFEDLGDYTDEQIDSTFNVVDTSYAITGFSTGFPPFMLVGFEYRELVPNLDLFVNYRQDLSEEFSFDLTPRLAFGLKYNPLAWLPLRAGFALGGMESFQWALGFGLNFSHYALDIGFAQDGGFFNNANGFSFSIGQQLTF